MRSKVNPTKILNLKEKPTNKILLLLLISTLIIFLILNIAVFSPVESALQSKSGYGVLDFEFAWTSAQIEKIFDAWGRNGMQKEAMVTYWDFLYLTCYSTFIFAILLLTSRQIQGKIQNLGIYASLTPIAAGIFDSIENVNLLLMISDDASIAAGSPFFASLCATIKFGLIFFDIIFWILELVVLLIQKFKK